MPAGVEKALPGFENYSFLCTYIRSPLFYPKLSGGKKMQVTGPFWS